MSQLQWTLSTFVESVRLNPLPCPKNADVTAHSTYNFGKRPRNPCFNRGSSRCIVVS